MCVCFVLVLGDLEVREAERLAGEDLAGAAEAGEVRRLVHQGRDHDLRPNPYRSATHTNTQHDFIARRK